jgi:hypothetical protein
LPFDSLLAGDTGIPLQVFLLRYNSNLSENNSDKLWSKFPLIEGRFKTLFTPTAPCLVAYAVIGRAIAGEIAFLGLDGFDQFGFEQVIGLNAVRSGYFPYVGDIHSSTPDFCYVRLLIEESHESLCNITLMEIIGYGCTKPGRLRERHTGKMPCRFDIVAVLSVIAEVFDEANEVGKCARHRHLLS